jgi:hypothetical protein
MGIEITNKTKEKRVASCIASWKNRNDYIQDIKHPYIYNVWRSFMFTLRGKKIGYDKSWSDYRTFYNDVFSAYTEGYRFQRINKKEAFGPLNYIWVPDNSLSILRDNTILITYNGESLSMKEWAIRLNVSYPGIKNRYYKHKEYSVDEVLLGKHKSPPKPKMNANELSYQKLRDKASKMCSSYRTKDRKSRFEFNLDIKWLIENILFKPCSYCGTKDHIGCDRIDNNKGHTKDNVIPCCYVCNTVRGNNFTVDEMKILGKCISGINKNRQ